MAQKPLICAVIPVFTPVLEMALEGASMLLP